MASIGDAAPLASEIGFDGVDITVRDGWHVAGGLRVPWPFSFMINSMGVAFDSSDGHDSGVVFKRRGTETMMLRNFKPPVWSP